MVPCNVIPAFGFVSWMFLLPSGCSLTPVDAQHLELTDHDLYIPAELAQSPFLYRPTETPIHRSPDLRAKPGTKERLLTMYLLKPYTKPHNILQRRSKAGRYLYIPAILYHGSVYSAAPTHLHVHPLRSSCNVTTADLNTVELPFTNQTVRGHLSCYLRPICIVIYYIRCSSKTSSTAITYLTLQINFVLLSQ